MPDQIDVHRGIMKPHVSFLCGIPDGARSGQRDLRRSYLQSEPACSFRELLGLAWTSSAIFLTVSVRYSFRSPCFIRSLRQRREVPTVRCEFSSKARMPWFVRRHGCLWALIFSAWLHSCCVPPVRDRPEFRRQLRRWVRTVETRTEPRSMKAG